MPATHTNPDIVSGNTMTKTTTALPWVPRSEMKSLRDILAYSNPKVIERYQIDLGLSAEEAKTLLNDTLAFLYLCATTDRTLEITPTPAIDIGWHGFLMFTRDYREFCKEYFGFFIHHQPFTAADKANRRGAPMKVVIGLASKLLSEPLSKNWTVANGEEIGKCDEGGDCSAGDCSGDCSPIHE